MVMKFAFPTVSKCFQISLVHCSPFISLCLRSIGKGRVISELCYKGTILLRNYRKMTLLYANSCHMDESFQDYS